MAWCPNCKTEYKEGITVCSDCNATLVASLDEVMDTPIINSGDPELIAKIKDYLEFNGINSDFNEDNQLAINNKDVDKAKKLVTVFLQQEAKRIVENEEFDEADLEELEDEQAMLKASLASQNDNVYRDKRDKAKDFESSAYALIVVGCLGIVFMVLLLLKVLPFELADNMLLKIVMPVLFVGCIIGGFKSKKEATKYFKLAEVEESLKVDIMNWCEETLTVENIDEECKSSEDEDMVEDLLYFKRFDVIKQRLTDTFTDLEPAFVDFMVDECYKKLYEV